MKMTIYWTATILLCTFLLLSAYTYVFSKSTFEGVKALGFPAFFIYQLAVLKIIAVIVLLVPGMPIPAKEWAYSGVMLFFITALVAHIAHKDSVGITLMLVLLTGILGMSYYTFKNYIN